MCENGKKCTPLVLYGFVFMSDDMRTPEWRYRKGYDKWIESCQSTTQETLSNARSTVSDAVKTRNTE
jgi:hypothetical protein